MTTTKHPRPLGKLELTQHPNGSVVLSQHWNPQWMPFKDRQWIANELEEIAARMRENQFEDEGSYREYKLPEATA